jgi:ATP-dependent DNA ligase
MRVSLAERDGNNGVRERCELNSSKQGVYESNKRTMLKVKHERECDCVVAGFRWHKGDKASAVGSLLFGLYDREGNLQHVGVCANFTSARGGELVQYLRP